MRRAPITSIEQLKRRRHLLLDLGPQKVFERKFVRINPKEVVGVLKGSIKGQPGQLYSLDLSDIATPGTCWPPAWTI